MGSAVAPRRAARARAGCSWAPRASAASSSSSRTTVHGLRGRPAPASAAATGLAPAATGRGRDHRSGAARRDCRPCGREQLRSGGCRTSQPGVAAPARAGDVPAAGRRLWARRPRGPRRPRPRQAPDPRAGTIALRLRPASGARAGCASGSSATGVRSGRGRSSLRPADAALRPRRGERERLGADQPLERPHDEPQRAQPRARDAIGRRDARLAVQRAATAGALLHPVREQHAHAARLVEAQEVRPGRRAAGSRARASRCARTARRSTSARPRRGR